MEIVRYARARNWPVLLGYLFFIGMMAVGYAYNVTFIQLGLVDLGLRGLGLNRNTVAASMAGLALVTCLVALLSGWAMWHRPATRDLRLRLRMAWAVVLAQTLLTAATAQIHGRESFQFWLLACAVTLGVGVPITFSFTVDLIPMRDRGLAAGLVTASAYLAAAVRPGDWRIETFRPQALLIMIPGVVALTALAFGRRGWLAATVDAWSTQRTMPRFARGRFVGPGEDVPLTPRFFLFVLLMFGVFFVDSLGFLRIVETPALVNSAWLAGDSGPRLIIGGTHAVTALIGGVLYTYLDARYLFFWIFGVFALVHFNYVIHEVISPATAPALGVPLLYAAAVSLYTVVNFALWADFSTPRSIGRNAAVGVALSGWTATFFSTALAIQWQNAGVTISQHLRWTNALALIFFLALLGLPLMTRGTREATP